MAGRVQTSAGQGWAAASSPEDKFFQALEDDQGEDDPLKVAYVALNDKIEDDKSEKCQFCIT